MGFHKKHLVGRVLHGERAKEEMAIHRRDSHGSEPVMHVPAQYAVVDNDIQTAVSVVYVTLAQTFSGPASFSTINGVTTTATPTVAATSISTDSASDPNASSAASTSLSPEESSYLSAVSAAQAVSTAQSSTAGLLTATSSLALATSTGLLTAGPTHGAPASTASLATTAAAATAAQSSASASGSTGGMSGAAKAGLVIALIVAIGMALGLIFFCWRRKKNPNGHQEILNEKHASFADAGARSYEARHMQNNQANMTEKVSPAVRSARTTSTAPRLSLRPGSSFLPMLGAGAAGAAATQAASSERRPSNSKQNPFGDASAVSEKQSRPNSPPTNPFEESQNVSNATRTPPKISLEGQEPTSMVMAGTGPNAAPASRGPNNVHRVQLDFKPSMEDELELRSGQLVRMLHEYDDGWALCIRMDRSQQGVAPRTCLSKLPVKPRPQGPPGNSRPGTSQSMEGRPSMQSQRSISPQQPSSRGPSPELGGGLPNRKPVPGQAM